MVEKIKATSDQCLLNEKQLGRTAITAGIAELLDKNEDLRPYLLDCLERHQKGDWGTAGNIQDTEITEEELKGGMWATDYTSKQNLGNIIRGDGPVWSYFEDNPTLITKLWIKTELNQNTTLLLPSER